MKTVPVRSHLRKSHASKHQFGMKFTGQVGGASYGARTKQQAHALKRLLLRTSMSPQQFARLEKAENGYAQVYFEHRKTAFYDKDLKQFQKLLNEGFKIDDAARKTWWKSTGRKRRNVKKYGPNTRTLYAQSIGARY